MRTEIDNIVCGTKFTAGSCNYELSNVNWSTTAAGFDQSLLIGDGSSELIIKCHPILGGQVQSKIDHWIRKDANVTIN